jgi:Fe(3+) dicitrate transport protein
MNFKFFKMGLGALLLLTSASSVFAVDEEQKAISATEIMMQEVSIIGSKFNIKDIAGSAAYLDVQDIRQHGVDDISRILRRVPGVNLREEDGFGLFPNISLRGVDSARSSKVTIMEDGILQAPAPYSAPSAYYSPTTGRMAGIEVLKGSSQVKYGPHTTGGAINYLSTAIPTTEKIYFKSSWGSFNEIRTHANFGNTEQLEGGGKFGYLVEIYTRNNRGFKELDTKGIPDLRNEASPDTGFAKQEPMLKLSYEPKTTNYQRWEAKFGYTNLDANETYLGLNGSDFENSPFKRLAASRFDEIESTQFRMYIRHFLEFDPKTSLVTTTYANTFNRNWQKLHDVNGGGGNTSLSVALAAPNSANFAVLDGTGAGSFRLRNNNRTYYQYGIQTALKHKAAMGSAEHEFELGLRWHYDQVRRKQWNETFTQNAAGAITAVATGARGSAGNRTQKTYATSVNASDTIKMGKFTLSPGVRVEHINAEYCEGSCGDTGIDEGQRSYAVLVGGGSLKYDVFDSGGQDFDLFTGIHRGFSPAGPRNNIRSGVEAETSVGIEVGARYKDAPKAFGAEAVFFHTMLNNLVVPDSIGGVGNGTSINAGKVRSMGVELQTNYDHGLRKGWAVQTPTYVSATYTNATFREVTNSNDQESIFAGAAVGNMVPYIPELSLSFGFGAIYKKWSAHIDANFVSDAFADGANTGSEGNPVTGEGDVRFGKIDSRLVMDATLGYQFNNKVRMFSTFKNITSQEYIVSRQPHGARPGLPFAMMAGLEFDL